MTLPAAAFDDLSPELALSAVDEAFGLGPDGSFFAYPSYVNRVYGLKGDDGVDYVAKFYRPGRWTREAILDEHGFLAELAAAEIPVVAPLADLDGQTLPELALETADGGETVFPFAVFRKRGGRLFDAENDDDWRRLGALAGRIHAVGSLKAAPHRIQVAPGLAADYAAEILDVVHPDEKPRLSALLKEAVSVVDEALAGRGGRRIRLHGDFHRGNVLDRGGEGLSAIDFDDMAMGPAVQDLWLLLPGHKEECSRELSRIMEGYEEFMPFDPTTLALVEPLRLLRMVHFLAWQARQRSDKGFLSAFSGWGSRAFWSTAAEDLADQLEQADAGRFPD